MFLAEMPQGWARKALFTVVSLGASEIGRFSKACNNFVMAGQSEVVPSPCCHVFLSSQTHNAIRADIMESQNMLN